MTLVALSASYGAGGSVLGPALARRLDVPFVDRAIPLAVADRLRVPYDEAAAHDQRASTGWLERLLSGFAGTDTGAPAPLPAETFSSEDFRRATENVLLQQAATGSGVILGRGSVVVLRDDPRALRVRLDGPPSRRVVLAMSLDPSLDRDQAERALRQFDRTHAAYLQQFYGVDIRDSTLYHLVLDPTFIGVDDCVEIIARAARCLRAGSPSINTSGR
jgi:cytidylate kinase